MYTRQYPENTCVGANCNSPFHMGEFVIWAKYNVGELGCGRIASHTPLRQLADFAPTTHAKNLMPISMIND